MTLEELTKKLAELTAGVSHQDQAATGAALGLFFKFCAENYDKLDGEARRRVDDVAEVLRENMQEAVKHLPDTAENRRLKRELASIGGEHQSADALLKILESDPQVTDDPIIGACRAATLEIVQYLLNVLYDVTKKSHQGSATFAKISLSFWTVDELLTALHLAQRGFSNQAYAHIRTVHEFVDKLELFHRDPKWADVWVSGTTKERLRELSPSAVRTKLGNAKHDPVYSYLSAIGTHGSFEGVQARVMARTPVEDRKQFTAFVGGSPLTQHIVWTCTMVVYTSTLMLVRSIEYFKDCLHGDEAVGMMRNASRVHSVFLRDHFCRWATLAGVDPQPNIDILDGPALRMDAELSERLPNHQAAAG